MTEIDKILAELEANDGACLYWQLSNSKIALDAVNTGFLEMVDDLVIHPDAVEVQRGMVYAMPSKCTQHRDDGRGVCIDCGQFL